MSFLTLSLDKREIQEEHEAMLFRALLEGMDLKGDQMQMISQTQRVAKLKQHFLLDDQALN